MVPFKNKGGLDFVKSLKLDLKSKLKDLKKIPFDLIYTKILVLLFNSVKCFNLGIVLTV